MAGYSGNLRNMTFSSEKGKDVKDTSMLSGDAKPTSAWKEKNSTTEHVVPAPPTDAGGANSGS